MDRLYVSYEKYRRMIAEKKILHRLVQGVRILTVALACYGWWGVIYPELTMLPSTYEIVYEETEATEAETVQTGPEVVEWNSDSHHRGIRFRYRRTDRCPGDHAADSQ